MEESQPLVTLIHKLEQTEKRYFSVYAKRHALEGKNIYLRLFERIASKIRCGDEDLRKLLPGQKLESHKHYLFQMVLKAMRGYHGGKGVEVQMRELIQDISFLATKRLFSPCIKLIRKAQKLGELHERFPELLRLLDIERKIAKFIYSDNLAKEFGRIEQDRKSIVHRMEIQYQYIELYDRLFIVLRQQLRLEREKALEQVRGLLQSPLLADSSIPASFHAKSYFFLCSAFCYQLLGDFGKAKELHKANVDLWTQNVHWINNEPFQYNRGLGNYLGCLQISDEWEQFPQILAKMKPNTGESLEDRAELFTNYHFYQLAYCMNSWNFEEAIQTAPAIQKGLMQYGDIIPDSRRMSFIYNLMVMFFFLGKPKEALAWLFKLLNIAKTEVRQDLQRAARIYLLILHYELGNLDLYDHLFPMVQRYLKPYGINDFEQQILDFLKALYRGGGLAWPRTSALALVDALEALTQAHSDAHFPGIREAIIWLRSRTEGRGMIEIGKNS